MTHYDQESVISTQQLQRRYDAVHAVRGLDLRVRAGELFGLIGPDGAGKTTTISCLAGLMLPSSGSVSVLGEDPVSPDAAVRERIGLMPQQYSLYGDLSVAENLYFFGRLFGLSKSTFLARRDRLLTITRLARFTNRRADALSGGMYKKLALACALLHTPKVLLLDEPTNGVDPVSRLELWELIYELVDEGMTVLVSTPYMDEAARCHRVALMHEGRIIAEGAPSVLAAELDHEVYEVSASDVDAIHRELDRRIDVVAASPAGTRVRVTLAAAHRQAVEQALRGMGATMRRVVPSFEDVFLSRVGRPREPAQEYT